MIERVNRTFLLAIGTVLFALGVVGLVRSYGGFGGDSEEERVLGRSVRRFVSDNTEWFWPLVAIVAGLIGLLAFRWLLAQLQRAPSLGELRVRREGPGGMTRVAGAGLGDALTSDVESSPEVRSAKARIDGDARDLEIDLSVDLYDDADVVRVRRRIEESALERFRQATEAEQVTARVRLHLTGPRGRTVG
ncbi:hypothetical protein BH20ACT24_BH20ACT24_00080 [soil metagenome]